MQDDPVALVEAAKGGGDLAGAGRESLRHRLQGWRVAARGNAIQELVVDA
jgi:hypothetical protein